ncbi:hypothetical protein ACF064_32485 [Streptomyces sp. NPDC015492]|uniref:hypothetical protein n=1 Tax=Streptomyces sp. NPDC015492 TaxID=3364958 RepID=UPI003700A087
MNPDRRRFLRQAAATAAGTGLVAAGMGAQPAAADNPFPNPLPFQTPSNPRISEWVLRKSFDKEAVWTNEYQGMCTDGVYWYIVTNKDQGGQQRLYKTTLDFSVVASIQAPNPSDHIGSPTYDARRGLVYIPLEPYESGEGPTGLSGASRIWQVAPTAGNIHTVASVPLTNKEGTDWGPQGGRAPWFAWHPWDGLVYSSTAGNADNGLHVWSFNGYDPVTGRLKKQMILDGVYHDFQGAGFGRDGRNIYVVSDHGFVSDGKKRIYAFDMTNPSDGKTSRCWGARVNPSTAEAEGIVHAHLAWNDAPNTDITVGMLSNQVDSDNVEFYHFSVPDPEAI